MSLGCSTGPEVVEIPEGAVPVASAHFEGAGVAIRHYDGFERRQRRVIRSESEWRATWQLVTGDVNLDLVPAVDWGEEIVILAAMSPRRIGGYNLRIDGVYSHEGDYYVVVRETTPTEVCLPASTTAPVDAVRVDRPAGRVFFVEQKGAHRCRQ